MSKLNKARPRLGRGLSSLLSLSGQGELGHDAPDDPSAASEEAESTGVKISPPPGTAILDLAVDSIVPNPHQPRRVFDETSLKDLAGSLKSTGLIQPIIVRQVADGFQLIAGERRLRAAKLAGLATLPAIVKEVDSFTQAQMALIENIQREDLNPIDRALAYRMLIDQLGLTQNELAGRLGEDRTAITHFLRLLDLVEPVRDMVRQGQLTVGHGKLLAGVADGQRQEELAKRAVEQGLSIRNLERLLETDTPSDAPATPSAKPSAHIRDLEKKLSARIWGCGSR